MAIPPDDMTITLKLDSTVLKDLYARIVKLANRVTVLEGEKPHVEYGGCGCQACVNVRLYRRIVALEGKMR